MEIDERRAFTSAAGWFRDVAGRTDGHWDEPGLGEWSVRDLVGHTSRALVTVETYLAAEPGEVTVASSAAYFQAVLTASSAAVAERGREAGRALGADPAGYVADLDARVQAAVSWAIDDAYVGTAAGGMRLIDYLPTRTFELVVHTVDLTRALGMPGEPPPDALASALNLAAQLAALRASGLEVLLALTGRLDLAPGFTLLRG